MNTLKNRIAVPLSLAIALVAITLLAFNYAGDSPPKRSNIGYINTGDLWAKMPEKAKADTTLAREKRILEKYYDELNVEYRQLYTELADTVSEMTDIIREEKMKKMKAMEERIVKYKKDGETRLSTKQGELYNPIKEKMQKAIDEVAEENGYDYILDSYYGNIIYVKNDADNIMDLVLKKLNITVEE